MLRVPPAGSPDAVPHAASANQEGSKTAEAGCCCWGPLRCVTRNQEVCLPAWYPISATKAATSTNHRGLQQQQQNKRAASEKSVCGFVHVMAGPESSLLHARACRNWFHTSSFSGASKILWLLHQVVASGNTTTTRSVLFRDDDTRNSSYFMQLPTRKS